MTKRQKRRKEVALAGKAAIIDGYNKKIEAYKGDADAAELVTNFQKKKALHEKEAQTLRDRLSGKTK